MHRNTSPFSLIIYRPLLRLLGFLQAVKAQPKVKMSGVRFLKSLKEKKRELTPRLSNIIRNYATILTTSAYIKATLRTVEDHYMW